MFQRLQLSISANECHRVVALQIHNATTTCDKLLHRIDARDGRKVADHLKLYRLHNHTYEHGSNASVMMLGH